ncbi:HNH endonuclease [Maribacter stanieri]|uniref:HNH endonuclease n=1 Tax=Maribacter stanieri TaxID=440514 RepID=A0A1I6HPU6_9FLAO|nr:HNH endonuclease [Maribacter stanieri]SFR56408.1 HNH endonuclease [Maribacter stanieri]
MAKRKSLTKKTRFEVFKRDKFQCQYCGNTAPEVVLNVDHIDPVANGGTNELINLITSCFDCNQGKKARLLNDDTVVKKQRKQMELIQERREQLELMLDWKKSLTEFEDEKVTMVSDYWASMMNPYSLNESGLKSLEKLIKKFPIEDILESIDIANKKYLTFDDEGKITKESVEEAFDKVGGICALKNMPELKQKMAYIKGICRNRFSYWDNRKGSIILNNYVSALKGAGWSDEKITEDLEKEVMPKSKEFKNWTQWRELLEKWTDDVINWSNEPKQDAEPVKPKEFELETLETYANVTVGESEDKIQVLEYFGKAFPKFNSKDFRKSVLKESLIVLNANGVEKEDVAEFTQNSDSLTYFEINEPFPENLGFLMVLETSALECMINLFDSFNISSDYYSEKDRKILRMLIKERINSIA